MKRSIREVAAMATVVLAITAGSSSAQAQFGYPGGYGGYGWGGWGGGVGTVQGDYARGLGAFAAGAGQYNEQTAVANSINADTLMRWNEYVYQSQMVTNRKFREKLDREKGTTLAARQRINDRLRNNPEPADINSGEALNVALDEVNNPRVYLRGLETAKTKIDGPSIRNIPFQYASAAIVTSISDLVNNGPPDLLKKPEFDADRTALKSVGAKIREKTEAGEQPVGADIEEAQALLRKIRKQLETNYNRSTAGFTDAQRYLRATYALTRMLQGPAIDVILSGVENRKEATFGDLIGFMNSFNLRFGRATTPDQRAAYSQIFPLLARARDEIAANAQPANNQTASNVHPHDFFAGMDPNDLESRKTLPPPSQPR